MEKKITLSLRRCLLLAGTMVFVSSCQDYEPFNDQQIQDVAYTHEFERKFGEIDPNQNWDLFGQLAGGYRGAVTRATDPSSVIVTFMDPLIVSYEDMVEYAKVLPEDGGNPPGYYAGALPYRYTNLNRVTQDFVTTAREFTIEQVNFFTSGVDVIGIYWYCEPNEPGSLQIIGQDGQNYWIQRKQIYENKTGMTGWRTIYEWVDLNPNQSGGYYDELFANFPDRYTTYDESQRVDLVGDETLAVGDKIFYTETQDEQTGEEIWRKCSRWYWSGTSYIPEIIRRDLMILHPDFVTADGSNAYLNNDRQPFGSGEFVKPLRTDEVYKTDYRDASSFFPAASYVRSTPINVKVPTSIPYYGFYISNGVGANPSAEQLKSGTRFSESNLNDPVFFNGDPDPNNNGWKSSHYVATFDIHDINPDMESRQYLCFEDWMGGATNFDLNDLVFKINLDPTTLIDHESTNEWALLVCEDLKSFDFDFNDVVLQLHYEEGLQRTYHRDIDGNVTSVDVVKDVPQLNITAMAAGGAYSSQVYINYHEGDSPWGEIHALLGETGNHGDHDHAIINAGETIGSLGQRITVPANQLPEPNLIGEDNENGYPTYLSQLFDTDGFFRIVCDEGREAQKIIKNGSYSYQQGVAPQMMLLPAYFEWPQEEVYIYDAYEGFSDWVQDAEKTQWIMATQIEKKITDRGDLWNSSSIGIEVGKMPMIVFHEQEFTYRDKYGVETTYPHCSKVDFTSSFPEGWTPSAEDYGLLTVVFSSKPGPTTYLDFADGKQIIEDKSASTVVTYHLSESQYAKAFQTGAIYFMCSNPDNAVVIETAELVTYRTSDSN